jgi:exodeoxyribonuclease VII large subunit
MEAISLYQLHHQIRRVMALNFPEALFIKAEISRINESRGHYYLEVVDKDEEDKHIRAKAQSVIWRTRYAALRRQHKDLLEELLQEGMKIAFHAQVDFHEVYGLKLMVEEIDVEYTLGAVAKERAEILERLSKEGLLEQNASLPLPSVIQRIAVISSPTAAGYQDFQDTLNQNAYGFAFTTELFPAAMQGLSVEKEVVSQLKSIEESIEEFDLIVIIRGGGGKIDLAYFDNYAIGKLIAKSSLPILTGIGHQIDETVTDLIAHTSLKTPTAVAEFIIYRNSLFLQHLQEYLLLLQRVMDKSLDTELWQLRLFREEIKNKSEQRIREHIQELRHAKEQLAHSVAQRIERDVDHLGSLEKQLRLMDPQNIFDRGFTAVEQKGKRITKSTSLHLKESYYIYFADGKKQIKGHGKEE